LLAPRAASQDGAPEGDESQPQSPAPPDQDEPFELEPLLITPTRTARRPFESAQATTTVDSETIERRAYRTLPQALRDVPGVMVQETAQGHGAPYLRGFTGYRTLFLIDGIRLNNSVFRDGPNQYWNTVDPLSLDRIEVVKGPSSVLYGSDAIGGTVQALTKSPWGYGAQTQLQGSFYLRYATAEHQRVGRLELSPTFGTDVGVLVGLSVKDFGDVQGGRDVGTQSETGYDEWDGDLKLETFLGDTTRLVIAHQRVDQNDVPRTHKTIHGLAWEGTTIGSDLQRNLDQTRELTYVQLHAVDLEGWFDRASVSLSWHVQEEQRDRIKSSGARDLQGFEVGTLGFFTHMGKATALGDLTWGLEYYRDDVSSFVSKDSGNSPADDIQGPVADDATYDLFGIFLQDELQVSQRTDLILGVRWNHAAADADSVRDPVTDQRTSIDDDWSDVVGSLRFVHALVPGVWNLFGGVSQGFRAPNLSDLTRFDSARSNEFEIPAPDLDAEHYTSFELGVRRQTGDLSGELSLFYTDIQDAIVRVPTGDTNADGEVEITKDNVGDGQVWGVEFSSAWRFDPAWTLFGNAAYLEGEQDVFPTSAPVAEKEYLDRLAPLRLQLGLRWEDPGQKFWAEFLTTWADDADRLSTRDRNDTQRIPPGGTPGYTVLDLRGGYRVRTGLSLTFGLENLTNEDYRVHGSGLNRPGTSLVVGLTWSF
ncbi:MAG: TonB-dependent receptor, partial [Planctomycetota bacterium]